jgi:transketolase
LQFGYGQFLTHQLVVNGIHPKVCSLGVHAEFGQSAYNAIELYSKHKLDSKAILEAALSLLK